MSEEFTLDIIEPQPLPDEVPPAPEAVEKPVDVPVEPKKEEAPSDATVAEDDPDDEHEDDEPREEPKRKRPGKYQRTVQRLEAQVQTLTTMLAAQANGGQQQRPNAEPAPAAKAEAPPKAEDFADYESFVVAKAKYELRQDMAREQQEARRRAEEQSRSQQQASFQDAVRAKIAAATEKFPDFEDVALDPSVPVTETMLQVCVASDKGDELAYHLGKNPAEAKRIAKLPPVAQVLELGKLEAKLAAPPPPPKKTKAPPPPPNLTGGAAPVSAPPDDPEAYRQWRMNAGKK